MTTEGRVASRQACEKAELRKRDVPGHWSDKGKETREEALDKGTKMMTQGQVASRQNCEKAELGRHNKSFSRPHTAGAGVWDERYPARLTHTALVSPPCPPASSPSPTPHPACIKSTLPPPPLPPKLHCSAPNPPHRYHAHRHPDSPSLQPCTLSLNPTTVRHPPPCSPAP